MASVDQTTQLPQLRTRAKKRLISKQSEVASEEIQPPPKNNAHPTLKHRPMGRNHPQKITNRQNNSLIEVTPTIDRYDFDVKEYIKKFNQEHQGKINLLDFSNYTTKFNDFKENPISQKDMEIIKEFQKRKIDQRLHKLKTQRYGSNPNNILRTKRRYRSRNQPPRLS